MKESNLEVSMSNQLKELSEEVQKRKSELANIHTEKMRNEIAGLRKQKKTTKLKLKLKPLFWVVCFLLIISEVTFASQYADQFINYIAQHGMVVAFSASLLVLVILSLPAGLMFYYVFPFIDAEKYDLRNYDLKISNLCLKLKYVSEEGVTEKDFNELEFFDFCQRIDREKFIQNLDKTESELF